MFKLPSFLVCFLFLLSFVCQAQNEVVFKITSNKKQPLDAVDVIANYVAVGKTNGSGIVIVPTSIVGQRLHFSSIGYESLDTQFHALPTDTIRIELKEQDKSMEEVVVVSSTRSNQRMENSPTKVEVLGREEMNEENSIKPAGIASILGDVSGVQIQQSSAVTGNANVRIQGLDSRYTQILKDGMPLYDGFSGGFGILSIPPLDLKQVELIKGSASTLYGGGAIGGLVNIISRKPTSEQEAVVTLNQTTLKETNANTFIAKRYKQFGYTFFGGYTYQKAVDVNGDGFSDVPRLNSVVVHPRLFFYPDDRTIITTGYTGTFETRTGGDMQVIAGNADANHQYFETNKINRSSFELSAERFFNQNRKLEFKNSISQFNRTIQNPSINFTGAQLNYYSELSLLIPYGNNSLVAGLNATGDRFRKITPNIPLNNFENNTIGAFVQNTWSVKDHVTIELGIRNDYHFTYGDFFLPRIAVFYKIDKHWASRAGIGFGYKTPNALSPQTTDIAIQDILPLPASIQAEKSIGYNAEVNFRTTWGDGNSLFINQAFFLTRLSNPIVATIAANGIATFGNESKPIVSKGFDTYVKSVWQRWELYAGYTYTIAERKYLADNQFLPLTPRNRFAFTIVRDFEKYGVRFGLEGSYNGSQYRVDYSHTPGYFFMAAMVEKKLGKHFSMVLNGENFLDFRQSRVEALYTGTQANPSFVPLWAPIDGRVVNLSLKWKF
ncbi:MAG: TonB-dependent receptor [Bacteroidetes bacterium]|nr:TonB-dependent receptor [Bacteroidota bacterium]